MGYLWNNSIIQFYVIIKKAKKIEKNVQSVRYGRLEAMMRSSPSRRLCLCTLQSNCSHFMSHCCNLLVCTTLPSGIFSGLGLAVD